MTDLLTKLGLNEPEESKSPGLQNPTDEISVNSEQAHEAARTDLNFLAALSIPDVFRFPFPSLFLTIWSWLLAFVHKEREFPQLALGLPRGFAKTTFVKIFVIFCILFTKRKFILIISSSATLAQNIIADIQDILDHPNIKKLFGDWRVGLEKDTQTLKKFGYRGRSITIVGIGAGTSLRGLNIKNERPDVMIFEDIQTRECADSQVESEKLEQWLFGTAMKAKSPFGCMFLFIANMYPTKHSILRKLKTNSTWVKFIVGGILEDGTSLWEDLQPLSQLMQEYQNDLEAGHPEIFYAEVLNDENASVNNLIDVSALPTYPYEENEIPGGNFIVIDPATGKVNGDAVSIGYFEVLNSKPALQDVIEDKFSPGDSIRIALELALTKNCRLIAVESNAYQYTFLYWFNFICRQLGISGIFCVEVYSGTLSKVSRILHMFKELKSGEQYYHPRTKALVNAQITQFNPLKNNNTDGILDLLTYAPKVMAMYEEYITAQDPLDSQGIEALGVIENNSAF